MSKTRSPRSAKDGASAAVTLPPSRWYGAALVMPVIGVVLYVVHTTQRDEYRLREPTPAMGEYVKAECVLVRRRGKAPSDELEITYAFIAAGYVEPAQGDRPEQTSPRLTMTDARKFVSRAECEAALPAVQAAKAPRQIWFERDHPRLARTIPEEPDRPELLLIGLWGIPFFAIGWLLRRRQRRRLLRERQAS